ncbi:MAG TPA: acyltransferase family protein [Solirubrobacterales bacterium]|nr:acyltransferase family protein [Solirubrobacterales bacterium]
MKQGRLNHIDALRGSVMLLLVPYHGLLFLQNRGDEMFGLDLSVFWLHLWRMGLFFAVSGFLAAMTLGAWGAAKQVRQRLKRIALPLFIAMLTILPAQKLIVFWFYHHNNPGSNKPAYEYTLANLVGWQPHHLWFLSYVLAFNLVAVAVWLLIRRGPRLTALADRFFRRFLGSPLLIPGLAALSALPLWLGGYLDAPGQVAASLIPLPSAFAYYGIFFVFGWMLWRSRDLLGVVEGDPWIKLAVALPAGVIAYTLYARIVTLPEAMPVAPTILFVSGIAAWSTIFAVWGFFARFLSGARPWVRYLADASYWIYLIHIPILVAAQLSLARTGLPPSIRVAIATSVSIGISLVTYALVVRYSPIGSLLHGKRHRRGGIDPAGPPPAAAAPLPIGPSRPVESP